MIWSGRTEEMYWADQREWHQVYAWVPVQMHDGRWVWLERYWARWMPIHGGLGWMLRSALDTDPAKVFPDPVPPPPPTAGSAVQRRAAP